MLQMNLIKKLKSSYEIRLSTDNRLICHNMGTKTIVYNFNSWEKIIELNKPKHPSQMRFSKNNDFLLIKSTTGTICVYDTSNFQLVKTIHPTGSFKIIEGNVNFTQDNLILDVIQTNNGQQIVSININTGDHTILTEFENPFTFIDYNHFVQNMSFHLFTLNYVNNETDYQENKIIKVNEPINKRSVSVEIISNPQKLIWDSVIYDSFNDFYILVDDYEIIVVDSAFKNVLKKKKFVNEDYPHEGTGYLWHIHIMNNCRFIVLTFSQSIFILRNEDLKTILVEKNPNLGHTFIFSEFTNDDQYLLVSTSENGYVLENSLLI